MRRGPRESCRRCARARESSARAALDLNWPDSHRTMPFRRPQQLFASFALVLALAAGAGARLLQQGGGTHTPTPADTVISNHAEATYTDDTGAGFATVSPTITVTVLPVNALIVTPDETAPSATIGRHETATRLFQICNTGNLTDLYTITRADATTPAVITNLYFDTDASGTVTSADTLITLNSTLSQRGAPGACLGVLAVVETNDFPPNSL